MYDEKLLLTVREVAELLGVSQSAIWTWVSDERFPPPLELGRLRRWRREDIVAYLSRQAETARGAAYA
jgi:excisionase family DNA binding protein